MRSREECTTGSRYYSRGFTRVKWMNQYFLNFYVSFVYDYAFFL
jgi:hypothetical protein